EFMRITADPGQGKGGTCYGDSGGPILLAGTNTILGVCSWGTNQNCAGISYEKRIDIADILNWISGFLD
ncbi:trypsin-like serine protease, partial [Candidatus Bathyarchaeota archaeon]|nr:trypsin-like serine protease [Candidatus Bathyarchaeota archaeon]